jgi:hypothetical protein
MKRLAIFPALFLGAITLAFCSGCSDPRQRQEVTGEVRLKGKPIEEGIINFAPLDGQETGDGALIVNGKYRIPKEKGLSPGKYKVSIYAGNGLSGEGNASPDSPNAGKAIPREKIPPSYNEKSKIVKEVVKGGENKFDFDVP